MRQIQVTGKKIEDFPTIKEFERNEKRRIIQHIASYHTVPPHNVNELSFIELRQWHREAHSDDIDWVNYLEAGNETTGGSRETNIAG